MKILARAVLATLAAIALAHGAWIITEGERRCYEALDLSTPGFVCSNELTLYSEVIYLSLLGLVIAVPLTFGIRALIRRDGSAAATGRVIALLPLMIIVIGAIAQAKKRGSLGSFVLDDLLGAFIPAAVALLPVWCIAFARRTRVSKSSNEDLA